MAIYHATLKSFSRGKGESSVAAAAYRAGFDLVDTATGLYHRYSHRHGVAHQQMLAPIGAPSWCYDAQQFWTANEEAETRANARVCREVEVALPHSLSDPQRKALALDLGQLLVNRYQVAVLVAIHAPSKEGDKRNHHVHLLMSARKVDSKGLGERAGMAFDSRQGGGAKAIRELRKAIEGVINAHLERAGGTDRVDHRTLRAQAREAALKQDFVRANELSRPPTKHMGKTRTAMMRQAKKLGLDHALTAGSFVERIISRRLQTAPETHGVPEGHSHQSALADHAREQAALPQVTTGKGNTAGKTGPVGGRIMPTAVPVGITRRISRVMRLARATGQDAEVLNAEAELVEQWLESQRQAAQDSLDMLRSVGGIQIEPQFQKAYTTLMCRRVDAYATSSFLYEDTERLAQAVMSYAHAVVRPQRARMAYLAARAKLSEYEATPHSREGARAKQRYFRAKAHISKRAAALQAAAVDQARTQMVEAGDHLEKRFGIRGSRAPTPGLSIGEDSLSNGVLSDGELDLRPRLGRPRA
ncbi:MULTISPECIES: MobA/MobL family protein [Stenotrophomonas]|uniref:MobA/MobL family protein n=1 Tax=Stenotrophomonas TaxID=40323 RepID=UPI0018D4C9AF|nr:MULTISPECIES: MobA/MobL family protein [Stenotrophomonas]MBH1524151.1 MobA/MobL family protein [Stenotrophomonas maltophilia]MBH1646689.1 MobA/MobL family protein [Stenotrophomonas maltophilia]MCO7474982.1 MobA/MobL family protein [Stenotrophomonas maltophilia]MDX5515862.1 MobA/MobL family protein [Stenotrophomonas sp. RG-453]UVH71529.1 MobA/MobL family protein [Stenotrophomonas maltophilia]